MNKDKIYYKVEELESYPETILTLWSGVMTNLGGMAWNYVRGFNKSDREDLKVFVKLLGWEEIEEDL